MLYGVSLWYKLNIFTSMVFFIYQVFVIFNQYSYDAVFIRKLTHSLTEWCILLLSDGVVSQLVNELFTFYGLWLFFGTRVHN
jgi:hypothetical protein